jgi:VanZ family protein
MAKAFKGRHRLFLRKRHKKALSLIAVILWMGVIFANSAMTGGVSSDFSLAVITAMETVVGWLGIGDISEGIKNAIQSDIFHTVIRKTAHFLEFGILGLLLVNWLKRLEKIKETYLHIAGAAFLFSAAYAATDEVHQLFVPGRAFSLWDILIDSAGALIFASLAYLHYRKMQRKP